MAGDLPAGTGLLEGLLIEFTWKGLWLLVLDGWRPSISDEMVGGPASFYLMVGKPAVYVEMA
jgi:hypothetical protein